MKTSTPTPKDESLRMWAGTGASFGWRVYLDSEGKEFAVFTATNSRCTAKYGHWQRREVSEMPQHALKAYSKSALAAYLAAQKAVKP